MNYVSIEELCEILNGYAFKSDNYVEEGVRIIRIANVQKGYIEDNTPVFCQYDNLELEKYMLMENDLLISLTGNVGRVALLTKEFLPAALNQRVACLRLKNKEVLKKYLFYCLSANGFEEKCIRSAKGVAQKNMSTEWLKKYKIPLYSSNEQIQIVRSLDFISRTINNRKKQLQKLDELIQARFVELFGLPLDKSKANMRFTDCVEFNPKKSEVKDMQDVEVSFVPMECVGVDGSFNIRENGLVSNYYKGYTYFRDGDVLLAKITPCFENGKAAIAEGCKNGIGFGTTEFHVARPKAGVSNSYWIKYMLKNDSVHELATINMTGSAGQKRIQTPFFDKLTIYCPPIELQNQFADFVNQVNKSKLVIKNLLQIYKHQIQM